MARCSMIAAFICVSFAINLISASAQVTGAPVKYANFYDALVADAKNHQMILDAINKDAATKALLKVKLNVTAFVPTDSAFTKAAAQFGVAADSSKLMGNQCLIKALLQYHIVTPGLTTEQLKKIGNSAAPTKNTMLLASTPGNPFKKTPQTLKFKMEKTCKDKTQPCKQSRLQVVGGGSSGYPVEPKNVMAGSGIITNIDAVLLPTTNITQLSKMTGCKIVL